MTTLSEAVQYLAGMCDGAQSQDGSGFNKFDARLGMELAVQPESTWAEQTKYNAWKMLKKYTKQLAKGGINYANLPELTNGFAKSDKRIYKSTAGQFVVTFPYNPALVAEVKDFPQRRFDGDSKSWIVAPTMANVTALWNFSQKHPEFEVAQSALDLMAEIDAGADDQPVEVQAAKVEQKPSCAGEIKVGSKKVNVTFTAIPDEATRNFMKSLPGWKYEDRQWSFPVEHAVKLAEKFSNHDGASQIVAQVQQAISQSNSQRNEAINKLKSAIDLSQPLPNGRTLFKHQIEGITRMMESHKLIVADDMGLGKTLQSLVTAKAWQIAFDYPTIVVCPASLKDNWLREAAGVEVGIEVYSWSKMPEAPDKPFVLICDEAHYGQAGKKSKRGAGMMDLASDENCKAAYMLTGTPMKNGRPVNIFPLLRAVDADIAKDKTAFEKRYCNAGPTRFSRWDVTGAAHLDELHQKCKPYLLRRLKKDCLDLPGKIRTMRPVELSAAAQKQYNQAFNQMREDYKARLAAGEISEEGEMLVMLTHLRRAGSIAKAETAIEFAEEILEAGNQVVLFTEFVESASQIAKALSRYGAELLTGDVTGKEGDGTETSKRQAMVDRFQAGKSKVFVSTGRAGGVGITLTKAADVILVDRPWTPGDAEQEEDRCNRIGQIGMVNVQWLQCGEIDQKVDKILLDKSTRIEMVLEGDRKTMRGTGSVMQQMKIELAKMMK